MLCTGMVRVVESRKCPKCGIDGIYIEAGKEVQEGLFEIKEAFCGFCSWDINDRKRKSDISGN